MRNGHIKIFVDYLDRLYKFLDKVKRYDANGDLILEARLASDMFPLHTQVQIAANFSLRSCCPIAKENVRSFNNEERSYAGLQRQLTRTIEYLRELDVIKADLSSGKISDMAGSIKVTLSTSDFLYRFAFPNFFFHISMVYAIARKSGVPASKGDFDGYHEYPIGFSFDD